ncbi:MAG TPA: hypothetical protein VHC00_13700 [Rhizobiaceae bacterium]|nr:hypothetical protein [Rhizobiaceae bacterium]
MALDLASILTRTGAWSCVKFEPDAGVMMIDAMTLPSMPDGLGMWVTDFGIANRTTVQTRFWTVAQEHRAIFLARVREANAHQTPRAKTAEDLAAELARQAVESRLKMYRQAMTSSLLRRSAHFSMTSSSK